MRKNSRTMRLSVLTTVSALALFGGAFASSASADSTSTPTPTVSPAPSANPFDSQVNDESDVQALIGDNQDEQDMLDVVINAGVNVGDVQAESVDIQEIDNGVDEIDAENSQESDIFNQDIAQADQNGNHHDAMELQVDASIVTSVTAPEAAAMASDDNEAHAILVGTLQK